VGHELFVVLPELREWGLLGGGVLGGAVVFLFEVLHGALFEVVDALDLFGGEEFGVFVVVFFAEVEEFLAVLEALFHVLGGLSVGFALGVLLVLGTEAPHFLLILAVGVDKAGGGGIVHGELVGDEVGLLFGHLFARKALMVTFLFG